MSLFLFQPTIPPSSLSLPRSLFTTTRATSFICSSATVGRNGGLRPRVSLPLSSIPRTWWCCSFCFFLTLGKTAKQVCRCYAEYAQFRPCLPRKRGSFSALSVPKSHTCLTRVNRHDTCCGSTTTGSGATPFVGRLRLEFLLRALASLAVCPRFLPLSFSEILFRPLPRLFRRLASIFFLQLFILFARVFTFLASSYSFSRSISCPQTKSETRLADTI